MSETTPEESTATAPTEEQEQPKPSETVAFWKQKAREQETRAKANADAAKELERIRESQKTAEQRQTEALQAAERRAANAERDLIRVQVAMEKGLRSDLLEFLTGDTREDIEARADKLSALQTPVADPPAANVSVRRPVETLRPGAAAAAPPADNSPRGLITAGLVEAESART